MAEKTEPITNLEPTRAMRLTLQLDADSMLDLVDALRDIANNAEHGRLTVGCCGAPRFGYIYELLNDPTITHDDYFNALRAYLDKAKNEK
jgi:hypothetical protein